MKRTWKRLVMMLSMLVVACSLNVNVSAMNTSEVNTKLNSLMKKYVGTTWNGYYYGSQCKGFANLMFQQIFGITNIGPYEESGKYYIPSPQGSTEVGRLSPSQMTQAKATELLKKGVPGDFIQVRRRNKTYGHSMILVSSNSSDITVFDCNSDGRNGVRKYNISYTDFFNKNSAMSLYHAKDYNYVIDHVPFGAAQQMEGRTGAIYVRGWAIDEDALSKALEIHIYVGEHCYARTANQKRTDVGALHKGAGDYHGFEYTIPVNETGRQRIRVFAINIGNSGSNTLIGETYVNIGKANSASVPDLKSKAHVEEKGWLAQVSAGQTCGTTGQARKMEALICYLKTADGKSGIKYRSHCQDVGWENGWRSSGEISGSVGKNRRLEAIQIALCNGLEKQYDVLYRTHVRDLGWTAWVKNGATSGTTGKGLAAEAVQIKLVRK